VAEETDLVVRQGVLKVRVSTVFTNFDVVSFYLPPSWKYMYMKVTELEKASQALARKQALETTLSVVDSKLPTIVSGTANLNRVQREFEMKNELKNMMSLTSQVGLHHVTEILGENVITWKAWPGYSGRKYRALEKLYEV